MKMDSRDLRESQQTLAFGSSVILLLANSSENECSFSYDVVKLCVWKKSGCFSYKSSLILSSKVLITSCYLPWGGRNREEDCFFFLNQSLICFITFVKISCLFIDLLSCFVHILLILYVCKQRIIYFGCVYLKK